MLITKLYQLKQNAHGHIILNPIINGLLLTVHYWQVYKTQIQFGKRHNTNFCHTVYNGKAAQTFVIPYTIVKYTVQTMVITYYTNLVKYTE